MTDKPMREFFVVGSGAKDEVRLCASKTPRAAAVEALNSAPFAECGEVEVFEIGRGRRYVRQSTAVPAGKGQ